MEFIVNNKKFSILNHELFINYIMVDSYFRDYSKYDYDIHFDFLDGVLSKEKVEFKDILEGTKGSNKPIKVLENRIEAIKFAISIAEKDDIIVLAGKGHETYQILKDGTIHLDEREVVEEALAELNK